MSVYRFYIDGYNLYYRALRHNGLQWLDLGRFCEYAAGGRVDKIIYCTARVSDTSNDPQKSVRQQAYLRALGTVPNVEIVYGFFKREASAHELLKCKGPSPCVVQTWKTEEKGSDVNLASRLIHDAHLGRFDRAFVVSGDSDLVEPIRLVIDEIGREVEVLNPSGNKTSKELSGVATRYRKVDIAHLQKSQLPNPIDIPGKSPIHKPVKWTRKQNKQVTDTEYGNCTQCGACIKTRTFH